MRRQHAVLGFEAAAVAGLVIRTSDQVSRTGMNRVAEVRFGYPFAVVAVAVDALDPETNLVTYGPWRMTCRSDGYPMYWPRDLRRCELLGAA